jgi:[protein-PII] uridylyltransferase
MSPKPSESATKIVASPRSNPDLIRQEFASSEDAAAAIASRSALVDALVSDAYTAWLAETFPQGVAVLAVGGFGRSELFPHSDIDVLLLVDKEIQGNRQREALGAFLRTLWDSGLRVSQSVRTVSECCQLDSSNVELSMSLLDERFLVGDRALYDQLSLKLPKFIQSQRQQLIKHLCEMSRSRHAKFHATIYHLEPNIKETPGGMRDLHLVHWLSLLRGVEDESLAPLSVAREFLSRLRCKLHYKFGRDNNLLTFDVQEEIAPDPAVWMRDYYRHARAIHQTALRHMELAEGLSEGGLLKQFRDWRSRLSNAEFSVNRDRVFFRTPQNIMADPELVLRLFEFIARHGIRASLDTERRIAENLLGLKGYFAESRPLWPLIRAILAEPNAGLALRSMHDTGILPALFPEWHKIESLVVRDFYHRYTVDEHTLITIESIEELRESKDPARRRFTDLLKETEDLPLVYMALLFHDTGKAEGMQGHAEASVRYARVVLRRIQMPAEQAAKVLSLISNHLAISAVMNARDLSDPATARELALRVATHENLKWLTILTYADISAVNPEAMTPWRLEQLWRTYAVTHRELTRELDTERIAAAPEGRADQNFVAGFPTRYLWTHSEAEVQNHIELAELSRAAGVAVDVSRREGTYNVTVVTTDRPKLFASLAGAISSFGMNIVKAEAFANQKGTVLDTFMFSDPMRTLELNPMEIDRLKLTLQRVALGKEDVKKLLKGRVRPKQRHLEIQPSVSFDSEASQSSTLVEILAEDRPGLLYDLSSTISDAGCSIDVVLIDTEAEKALDVFYVTSEGAKLTADRQASLKDELLNVCRT